MLYLEDYLEMIEHLPQELRDRFTEMREMDLAVQNSMDSLDKRVRQLFSSCRRGEMTHEQAVVEFGEIKRGYNKTLEDAEEKVQLANQMYELVERYIKRLDTELHKFKCELEADNKGITEVLEKRSLELDAPAPSQNSHYNKENRYDSRYRIKSEKRYADSWGNSRDHKVNIVTGNTIVRNDSAIQAALRNETVSAAATGGYALASGSPFVSAASQAIAATQQMQHGRRSASLKASYEAVTGQDAMLDSTIPGYGHHVTVSQAQQSTSHAHSSGTGSSANKRHKKKTNYAALSGSAAASRSSSPVPDPSMNTTVMTSIEEGLEEAEWVYDPNEPRYCICNQVSYGDMVACDNDECPYEWFHYPCVGITAPPKGKWYCPQCTTNMRRNRNSRKN